MDLIEAIVASMFPLFCSTNFDFNSFISSAILAPTLDLADKIIKYMRSLNDADGRTYCSSCTICKSNSSAGAMVDLHTSKFLNTLRYSGVPSHSLILKVGFQSCC